MQHYIETLILFVNGVKCNCTLIYDLCYFNSSVQQRNIKFKRVEFTFPYCRAPTHQSNLHEHTGQNQQQKTLRNIVLPLQLAPTECLVLNRRNPHIHAKL